MRRLWERQAWRRSSSRGSTDGRSIGCAGGSEQAGSPQVLDLFTAQQQIELARLERNITRLSTVQSSATIPLVVLGGAATVAQGAELNTLQWAVMLIAAILLIIAPVISFTTIERWGGVAALDSKKLESWQKWHDAAESVLIRWRCDQVLSAIKLQETANEKMRTAWLWSSRLQTFGLFLALGAVLSLLYPR